MGPDLFKGMIVAGDYGSDIAYYTGSTTGTTRDNDICSAYSPITWQVDRKCHMISASSFDKMCADMKTQADDMSDDLYAHGSRKLVSKSLASAQETPSEQTPGRGAGPLRGSPAPGQVSPWLDHHAFLPHPHSVVIAVTPNGADVPPP